VKATEVIAGLAESNGSLLPGIRRDSLHVTCGLTACTPGSAHGPTLGNEYGKTLPLPFTVLVARSQKGALLLPLQVTSNFVTASAHCPSMSPVEIRAPHLIHGRSFRPTQVHTLNDILIGSAHSRYLHADTQTDHATFCRDRATFSCCARHVA